MGMLGVLFGVVQREADQRRKIYKRVDEERDKTSLLYVHQDVCHERMDRLSSDIAEIKVDVKELLKR